jgi:hypothetical protein
MAGGRTRRESYHKTGLIIEQSSTDRFPACLGRSIKLRCHRIVTTMDSMVTG